MASFGTPKKPSSDVCRICGTHFRKDKRDKVSLFHSTARLHSLLQEATVLDVREDDGFPQFVCTTCRNQLLKFERVNRQLEETRTLLRETSRQTAMTCRFKRRRRQSPGTQQASKKPDQTASPASPSRHEMCSSSGGQPSRSKATRSLFKFQPGRDLHPFGVESSEVTPLLLEVREEISIDSPALVDVDNTGNRPLGAAEVPAEVSASASSMDIPAVATAGLTSQIDIPIPEFQKSDRNEERLVRNGPEEFDASHFVKVTVKYPSRKYKRILNPALVGIGRALASGNISRLARAISNVPDLMLKVTDCLCKTVNKECENLCTPSSNCVLRNTSHSELASFKIENVANEFAGSAPTLWKLLTAAACSQWQSSITCSSLSVRLSMAAACLLKARNLRMSAMQYIISIVLHNSGAKKKAFTRLNRLGLAMSHKRTLVKLRQMASTFDSSLVHWKECMESTQRCDQSIVHLASGEDDQAECTRSRDNGISIPSLPGSLMECNSSALSPVDHCLKLYQITGDNVDLEIKTKYMTLDRRNKSLHWFNLVATDERVVPPSLLSNDRPRCSILTVPDAAFLPCASDHQHLREEFAVFVSRVITKFLPAFAQFSKFVVQHVIHDHMSDASRKSERHCLGLLELNENIQQDMVEIMSYLNKRYVPYQFADDDNAVSQPTEALLPLQFGGDQLTAERARNSKRAVINGQLPYERLEALLPHAEDFHCSMNFVNLIYAKFYKTNSGGDFGTMYNLRNKLDRRNVSSDTNKNYRACNSFLQDVLDGYIIACAVQHFGMRSPEDMDAVPPGLPEHHRAEWFQGEIIRIVDKFVLQWKHLEQDYVSFQESVQGGRPSEQVQTVVDRHSDCERLGEMQSEPLHQHPLHQHLQHQQPLQQQPLQNPSLPCHVTTCGQRFSSADDRRHHEEISHCLTHVPSDLDQTQVSDRVFSQEQQHNDDHVFNYSCNFMKMALLERDFQDAVYEMDGPRLLRLWKFKMLHFKDAGRTKYALEAYFFQADQLALLSPWDAYRQLWNRTFNLHGGSGRNIPMDLMVEHSNNFIKEMIRNQGANVSFKSAQQVSRASMGLEAVLTNLDSMLAIADESNKHAAVDRKKDVLLIAKELGGNVSKQTRPRAHKAFPSMKYDVLQELNPCKLSQWIRGHKKALAKVQQLEILRST